MTAGQEGPDQQGWRQPPPGPPGYPGQQPPQGPPGYPGQQPPYGGYGPAPSAPPGWGGPPPEPMERPTTVRVGIGAFVATLVLGLVSAVVQFSDTDGFIDELQAQDPSITEDVARTALTVGIVLGLLIVALQALFIWFAWQGRNWARIVLFVLGGLTVVFGLAGLGGGTATGADGFLTSMAVFSWFLTLVGVVALALKPSSDWYRHETQRRRAMR
ncbi:hypothetical protein [Trujillonella humicola]|uniref:hypothetical protein n=1 Tax=Trujillonella humicola TaxID=3383699 RepID=UPI00390594B0